MGNSPTKVLGKFKKPPKPPILKKGIKPPSGWDLYEHGLSYSLLSRFIVCRERFRLRVVEGLVPSGKKEAMEFGTIFHKALELHSKGVTRSKMLAYFRNKSQARGKKKVEYDPLLCQICVAMLPRYVEHWHTDVLSKIDYFESEKVFDVKFRTTTGHVIPLRGKRDEGFVKDGNIWLQENKTKSEINEDQIILTLSSMLQPMLYLLSFQHDYPNRTVGGILYNVIRKPGLIQKQKESDKAYVQRILDDIDDRPDHYFKMFEVDIVKKDIDLWVARYLNPLLCQVALWWESIKHNPFEPWTTPDAQGKLVPNPHHFLRPFGVYDPMSKGVGDYFSRVVLGHDVGLEIQPNLFPELEDDDDLIVLSK